MRRLLVFLVLGGCVHATSSSPAWPKDRTDSEGGESLAPHEAAKSIEVALENDDADKPAQAPADKPVDKPAAATEGGAPAATAPAATEEPIQTEEIVIEVGGDD
jgi:hypothetical protein